MLRTFRAVLKGNLQRMARGSQWVAPGRLPTALLVADRTVQVLVTLLDED